MEPSSGKVSNEQNADPALFHFAVCRDDSGIWMGDRGCRGPVQRNRDLHFAIISTSGETFFSPSGSSSEPPLSKTSSTTSSTTSGKTPFGKRSSTPTASHPEGDSPSVASCEKPGTPLESIHGWVRDSFGPRSFDRQPGVHLEARVHPGPPATAPARIDVARFGAAPGGSSYPYSSGQKNCHSGSKSVAGGTLAGHERSKGPITE